MNKTNIFIGTIEQLEYSYRLKDYVKKQNKITIDVSIVDGKLSISGEIGKNECGQIDISFEHKEPKQNDERYIDNLIKADDIKYADGWNKEKWFKLLDVWSRWHLNDMNPSCEHQEALGWLDIASESVKLYKWKLKMEVVNEQDDIKDNAIKELIEKNYAKISPAQSELLKLEYWIKTETEQLPEAISQYYKEDDDHIETKKLGWLNESEHSKGILSKACPTCGYKYGNAWKKRELPADVVDFITNL